LAGFCPIDQIAQILLGPFGLVPQLQRYYSDAPTSCRSSRLASFSLRVSIPVRRGPCSLSTLAPRCLHGAKGFGFRLPFRIIRRETAGSPRFLGNPCTLALLFDPGRPRASRR
jgi:hypothetical protein